MYINSLVVSSSVSSMKGYLWVINEAGIVAKLYFDREKQLVKRMKLAKRDYEVAFKISAWVLRLAGKRPLAVGEMGAAKENIIYAMKGTLIVILQANIDISNSPYIYGFLKKIIEKIRANVDGVVIVDYIEKDLIEMLKNLPKPLLMAKPKYDLML